MMTRDLNSLEAFRSTALIIVHTHRRKTKPKKRMAVELVAAAIRSRDTIVAIYPVPSK
jgi:hypothetical protein